MIYTEGNCIFQHDTNLKVQIVCNSGNAICDKDKKNRLRSQQKLM